MNHHDTADSLLDIARTTDIRSTLERRFSDYCHACSNRLNSIKLGLYLAQRQSAGRSMQLLQTARARYDTLEHQFELFRAVCRPIKLNPIRLDLALLVEDRRSSWSQSLAGQGVQLHIEPPGQPVEVTLDPERMGQALDALVAWRRRVLPPGSLVTLHWSRLGDSLRSGSATLTWQEFPAADRKSPNPSLDSESTWHYALLTKIVTEHGCAFSCQDQGGWQAEVLWPGSEAARPS